MLISGNKDFQAATALDPEDIALGGLLAFMDEHKQKPVVFFYDGKAIQSGYHITEVKAGDFAALDCGGNPESWTEMFVQLWDVNEDPAHMNAGKFSAIIRKVSEHLSLDQAAKLTFEVSDGVKPMQLYRAALPQIASGEIHVQLSPRPASCKPRDRWLEEQKKASACCGPTAASEKPCCG